MHEGSRDLRVTKQRALIKSLTARAIKGDTAAAVKPVDLYIRIFGLQDQGIAEFDATFVCRGAGGVSRLNPAS